MREIIRRFRLLFFLGGALFLIAAIAGSVYVVQTKRTENRSKASMPISEQPTNSFELPIVEFGTIEKITGVGYKPEKTLAQKPSSVLGESTEATPGTHYCWNRVTLRDNTYQWVNGCKGNPAQAACTEAFIQLTPDETTGYQNWVASGSAQYPECGPSPTAIPTCMPMPDDCNKQFPDGSFVECFPPPWGFCPKPTSKPPQPARYIFKTFDGRTYVLSQPQFRCPKGENCIQVMPQELNFDQYLGTPVMIQGLLKRSRCKYAPEVTDYRCEPLQNLLESELSIQQTAFDWWPLPKDGILETRFIQKVKTMGKEEFPGPVNGVLSISPVSYRNENVYMIDDFRKCPWPLCGPKFIRSATTDLSRFLNQTIQATGRYYALSGDIFVDAVSISAIGPSVTPQPTPTPTPPPPGCYYQRVQCIQAPCDPILVCTTPTPPSSECVNKPSGSSCCFMPLCRPGFACIQVCQDGTCQNHVCTPNPTPTPTIQACLPADINKDGNVDPGDYNALLLDFFKTGSLSLNNPRSDINHDGVVDITDYSLLVQSFGKITGPCQ